MEGGEGRLRPRRQSGEVDDGGVVLDQPAQIDDGAAAVVAALRLQPGDELPRAPRRGLLLHRRAALGLRGGALARELQRTLVGRLDLVS